MQGLRGLVQREEVSHAAKSFFTDMVFDTFSVDGGRRWADSQSEEEAVNDFVSMLASFGQLFSLRSQFDWRMSCRDDESRFLETADRTTGSHMAYTKTICQVFDATLAKFGDDFRDGFDIVFGDFRSMVIARALVLIMTAIFHGISA